MHYYLDYFFIFLNENMTYFYYNLSLIYELHPPLTYLHSVLRHFALSIHHHCSLPLITHRPPPPLPSDMSGDQKKTAYMQNLWRILLFPDPHILPGQPNGKNPRKISKKSSNLKKMKMTGVYVITPSVSSFLTN